MPRHSGNSQPKGHGASGTKTQQQPKGNTMGQRGGGDSKGGKK